MRLLSPLLMRSPGEHSRMEIPDFGGAVLTGKYGPGWQPVYETRRAYTNAGINIAFPRGEAPVETYGGYTFSTEEEQYIPFHYMQQRFFDLIDQNPFHTVIPGKETVDGRTEGYIGFSSAHEIAYAILKSKPIVLATRITEISQQVPQDLFDVIEHNSDKFILEDPTQLSPTELRRTIQRLPESLNYSITEAQANATDTEHTRLCRIELHRWLSWTQKTERDFAAGMRPDWINERMERQLTEPAAYLPWEETAQDPDAHMYLHEMGHIAFLGKYSSIPNDENRYR